MKTNSMQLREKYKEVRQRAYSPTVTRIGGGERIIASTDNKTKSFMKIMAF